MHRFLGLSIRGVTAIEVAIGVSIASLVLIFTMQSLALFINTGRTLSEKTKAIYLIEDGMETLRFIRDDSWTTIGALSLNTPYYLSVTSAAVNVTATPQTIDGYTRSFKLTNVYRNSSDDIVASTTGGAVADPESKYVTMSVVGGSPVSTSSITTILSHLEP